MIFKLHCSFLNLITLPTSVGEGDEVFLHITSDYELKNKARVFVNDKKYVFKGEDIDITEFCKIPGKVNIEIADTVDGEVVHRWTVTPLLVKQIEADFKPIPQITALENEIAVLKNAIKELYKLYKGE